MRVSVFGLGYVGGHSAACLARDGHNVIGVEELRDISASSILRSSIAEPRPERLIAEAGNSGRFRKAPDTRSAVLKSDISLICVSAPGKPNGSLNLGILDDICISIGRALACKEEYHLVILRTTVLPGTVEGRLVLLLEQHSARQAGRDFGVCIYPPSCPLSGAEDFDFPSEIVIGELDTRSGDTAQQLYDGTNSHLIRTSIRTAEMLSYVNNAFRAVKATFANEIGNLCAAHGIDGQELMDYVCLDRRLNISPAYLKPGFSFGGACLPKDLRALIYCAKEQDIDCPLLNAVMPSNQMQVLRAIELVEKARRSKVGILGLGLKADSSDMLENPIVDLAEKLVGKGYELRIFDENLDTPRVTIANMSFPERALPHIMKLVSPSLQEVVQESEVLVIANDDGATRKIPESLLNERILIHLGGHERTSHPREIRR